VYDIESGVREWVYAIHDDAGNFFAPPVTGEDGTLYCIGEHGYLTAINPDGSLAWVRLEDVNNIGHQFLHSPVLGPDGTIYVNSVLKNLYAYGPDGSERYHVQFDYQVFMAHPIVTSDGRLYIGSLNGNLYALEPDGTMRFTSEAEGSFLSSPLLSLDGNLIFMTADRQKVLAFDAQDGQLTWEYAIEGRLDARTILGPNGNLHFVDDLGIYYTFTSQGIRVFSYAGFLDVDQSPVVNNDGVVYLHANHAKLVTLTRLLNEWDGSPDVLPGSDTEHVRLVYPFSIDTGADVLHEQGLTGAGVTLAVVDSGVYFDQQTRDTFGALLASNYLGQADFYGAGTCPDSASGPIQYTGYCQSDYASSYDGFGHGSHVAGIIWNNLKDEYTGAWMGVAPNAKILSVRVLGDEGSGSYADVIEGIQYVVANKDAYGIRVMNLSISAESSTPYFVDPIDRAVEEAWAAGIVVLAAAGNVGAAPETITVPGNDPYVITVGSLNGMRTPGYWADDRLVTWASSGPTLDGFIKPDVLAPGMNIVSYMHNAGIFEDSAYLVQQHPDYSSEYNSSLFRMNGTSMATAVASGVVALMLEHDPALTPDQVKFRLAYSALQLFDDQDLLVGNLLRQGAGRLWAPEAVFAEMPDGNGNAGMDLAADLAHGWQTPEDILYHYEGPLRKILSDDGSVTLYYIDGGNGVAHALGGFRADTGQWLTSEEMQYHATFNLAGELVWDGGNISWESGVLIWSGGALYDSLGNLVWQDAELIISDGQLFDSEGNLIWSDGDLFDASGRLVWSGGRLVWSGANMVWDGGNLIWEGSELFDASGNLVWDGLSSLIWSGGYLYDPAGILVWSGGDLFDSAGRLVWSGGCLVWSGGRLVWSGGRLVWSGGRLEWSGGRLVWSGSRLVWSGGRLVWSGGRLVWSGSSTDWWESTATQSFAASAAGEEDDLVWAGGNPNWLGGQLVWQERGTNWPENFPTQAAQMHSNNWVNDGGTVEPLKQTFIHAIFLPITIR
jgi:subtilisin family serine protease